MDASVADRWILGGGCSASALFLFLGEYGLFSRALINGRRRSCKMVLVTSIVFEADDDDDDDDDDDMTILISAQKLTDVSLIYRT